MARTYRATLITATDEDRVLTEGLPFNESAERAALAVIGYKDACKPWSAPEPVVVFEADGQPRAWMLDNVVRVGLRGEPDAEVAEALRILRQERPDHD